MILSDHEIQEAMEFGLLLIEPPPDPSVFSSTAPNLTIDRVISWFGTGLPGTRRVAAVRLTAGLASAQETFGRLRRDGDGDFTIDYHE